MKFYVIVAASLLLSAFLIPLSFSGTPLPYGSSASLTAAAAQTGQVPSKTQSPYYENSITGDYVKVLDKGSGKVFTVTWQDYVRGALCAEMPPSFHPEAMKAQAVAAHTYALYNQMRQREQPDPELKGADIAADLSKFAGFVTEKQARERFGDNFELYWGMICKAADSVQSYVIMYEDEPIVAAYHSISAGYTEDASNVWTGTAEYLRPVESKGDILSPGFESTAAFTAEQSKKLLLAEYPDMELSGMPESWFSKVERSSSGYVTSLDVGGITLHGKDIRRIFSLRSSGFTTVFTANSITFKVNGYGHGVGMSQYGADYMARQGSSFDEILAHYYSGTRLAVVK